MTNAAVFWEGVLGAIRGHLTLLALVLGASLPVAAQDDPQFMSIPTESSLAGAEDLTAKERL